MKIQNKGYMIRDEKYKIMDTGWEMKITNKRYRMGDENTK